MKNKFSKSVNLGYFLVVADMFIYGLFPVFAHKFSYTMNPLLFAGLAMLVGSLPFTILLVKQKKFSIMYSTSYLKPLLMIALLTALGSMAFFSGTRLSSGINTGLIIQIEPVYSVILSAILLHEVIKKDQLFSTIIMVFGAMVVAYKGLSAVNIGDLFLVTVPLFFQLSHVIMKKILVRSKDPNFIIVSRLLYGGLIVTIVALISNPADITQLSSFNNLFNIVIFGLIFRAFDFFLWHQGLARLPLSKASAILPLSVAISFLGSILILKEVPTLNQYLGLMLIGGGMFWLTLQHFRITNVGLVGNFRKLKNENKN